MQVADTSGLVRNSQLGRDRRGDEENRGEAIVVTLRPTAIAVPVIGPELCGILSPPFCTAVVFEEEPE
jgi:hypothetical protein